MKPIFLTLAVILFSFPFFAGQRMVARIDFPSHATLERFVIEGADIAAYKPCVWPDLVLSQSQFDLLRASGPNGHFIMHKLARIR